MVKDAEDLADFVSINKLALIEFYLDLCLRFLKDGGLQRNFKVIEYLSHHVNLLTYLLLYSDRLADLAEDFAPFFYDLILLFYE